MQCVAVVLQCVGVVLQCAGMRAIHQDIVNVIPLNYLQIYIIFMCSLLYTHAAVPQCHSCCCAAMCHDASLCETRLFHSLGTHPHAQSLPIHVCDMSDT